MNNIMIDEDGRGDEVVRSGVLIDWELCQYKEEMGDTGNEEPSPPVFLVRLPCSLLYTYADVCESLRVHGPSAQRCPSSSHGSPTRSLTTLSHLYTSITVASLGSTIPTTHRTSSNT